MDILRENKGKRLESLFDVEQSAARFGQMKRRSFNLTFALLLHPLKRPDMLF